MADPRAPEIATFTPLHHSHARGAGGERAPTEADIELGNATGADSINAGWGATVSLAFVGLGVIYGDLGTSPLYALNGIWPASGPLPSEEDIIGGVSA